MYRLPFNPSASFVAAKPFSYKGERDFVRGEVFPAEEMGIAGRPLRILWQAHLIDVVAPQTTAVGRPGKGNA